MRSSIRINASFSSSADGRGVALYPVQIRCRILVIDDEEIDVHLMTRVLQTAGYLDVRGITDSREALDLVRNWSPDLVLLDLHMPNVDGISLLLAIRAELAASEFLPVLVLSADASHESLARAMSAGANDFLTKPLVIDEVLLRVRNLLAFRLSHEALKDSNAALATTLRRQLQSEELQSEDYDERIGVVRALVDSGPSVVFQPIIELSTNHLVGFEALSRFDSTRPTDNWFAEATSLGMGVELELAAIKSAFEHFDLLTEHEFMAVNVSPAVMFNDRFYELVRRPGRDRVVVEITEQQPVENYANLKHVCSELRDDGIRVAIDDAGAGYASLQNILLLRPDIIKFDLSLTRHIDRDPVKRALTVSLLKFAAENDAIVTAEGVESAGELLTLRTLGVPWGQGFHIGYPESLADRTRAIFPVA